jgi:hypothetical protein
MRTNKAGAALISFITIITPFILKPAFANELSNARNSRYCEVVVGHGFSAKVYTSIRLNECPENLWKKINVSQIKKEQKATFVYLNGPRYLVMDQAISASTLSNKIIDFSGIKMREVAKLKVTLSNIIKGFVPYTTHNVEKQTTWFYDEGSRIYELIDPKNQVYVMQSYSVEIAPLKEDSLMALAAKLKLPSGWKFKTGILSARHDLSTINNHAIVIQDNYKNTYQLAKCDFLN